MKALTIHQPYAQLIAIGAKWYETRNWRTNYRGPILIHAGLSRDFYKTEVNTEERYRFLDVAQKILGSDGLLQLPLGAVIATAELVGCWEMGVFMDDPSAIIIGWSEPKIIRRADNEYLFGDWTPGRYAWELANVQLLPEPIPARGRQGLWDFEMEAV